MEGEEEGGLGSGTGRISSIRPNGCGCMSLNKHPEAQGVNYNGIARGAISMSNVYLGNSMILLACKAAGGANDEGTQCVNPNTSIYGMRPAALISNVALVASLLAAFVMPPMGAIVDFTPHRKLVGIILAVLLAVISAIQIATVEVSLITLYCVWNREFESFLSRIWTWKHCVLIAIDSAQQKCNTN